MIASWWECDFWVSQDGTTRYPARGEMSTEHMSNCIAFIERNMSQYYRRNRIYGQDLEEFTEMIRNSRIYKLLQACLNGTAHEVKDSPSCKWGVRGGVQNGW